MKLKKLALLGAILLMLTSCSGQTVELLDFLGNDTGDVDFEGLTFTLCDDGFIIKVEEDLSKMLTEREEMLFARYEEIEDTYNCTIKFEEWNEDTLLARKAGGLNYADILNMRLNRVYEEYINGYLLPLSDLPYVDLTDEKYGSAEFIESMTWNGDTVCAYPQYWGIMTPNFCDAVYFNPDVFTLINLPNPHELYEQGAWNWEALENIGKACLDASSPEKPMYMSTLNNYFARMMILSNGGQYIKENADGKYEYGLVTDEVFAALEKTNSFYNEGYLIDYPGSVDDALTLFVDNQIALIAEYSVQGIFFDNGVIGVGMQGEYCWAHNPIGPSGTDQTTGLISNENQYMFATNEKATDIESLGKFVDILFEPISDEPMDWVDVFLNMNFYDETSMDVFMTKFENSVFDHVVFAYQDDTIYDAILQAAETGAIRENIEKLQSQANAKLDEGINKGK